MFFMSKYGKQNVHVLLELSEVVNLQLDKDKALALLGNGVSRNGRKLIMFYYDTYETTTCTHTK